MITQPTINYTDDGRLQARCGGMLATFERPGELAEQRFNLLPALDALNISDGHAGVTAAYELLPFLSDPWPVPTFGDVVTPAFREAFQLVMDDFLGEKSEEQWAMRGELNSFLVMARRYGDVWKVGCITVAAQAMTVRLEDLWTRLPVSRRHDQYLIDIVRDPTAADSETDVVREVFPDQAPDTRIFLELKASGGFVLTFWPQC